MASFSEFADQYLARIEEEKKKQNQNQGQRAESFSEFADRYLNPSTNINTWLQQPRSISSDISNFYNTWRSKTDSEKYNSSNLKRIQTLLAQADSWRKQYAGNDEAIAAIDQTVKDLSSLIYTAKSGSKYYSQWDTEDAYTKWSDYSTTSGRQKRYEDNQAEIDRLTEQLNGSAPWQRNEIKSKIKALQQEMQMYERGNTDSSGFYYGSKAVDDYTQLESREDFQQASANRNFQNPSRDELRELDILTNPNTWRFNDDGSIYDAMGNQIDPNNTDERGNILHPLAGAGVTDRLGLFLNATDEEKQEAYGSYMMYGDEGSWEAAIKDGADGSWAQLKDNEISIYYYLMNTSGRDAADQYLADMKPELNRREAEQSSATLRQQFEESNALERLALSIASIGTQQFGGLAGFIEDTANTILGNDINPYSHAHTGQIWGNEVRALEAQRWDDATGNVAIPFINFSAGDLYQAGMSSLDMLFGAALDGTGFSQALQNVTEPFELALLAKINNTLPNLKLIEKMGLLDENGVLIKRIGVGAYELLMGTGSATAEARKLYEQGANNYQIAVGASLVGAAEIISEHASIEKLFYDMDPQTKLDWVKSLLIQGGFEASEEGFTEIANTLTNIAVMGDQSDWAQLVKENGGDYGKAFLQKVSDTLNAAMGGFVSGVASSGATGAVGLAANEIDQNIHYNEQGRNIVASGNLGGLIQSANELRDTKGSAKLKELANQLAGVDEKFVGPATRSESRSLEKKAGQLYKGVLSEQAQQADDSRRTVFDRMVKQQLEESGFGNVDQATRVISKAMYGGSLTKPESRLFDSVNGRKVIENVLNAKDADNNSRFETETQKEATRKTSAFVDTYMMANGGTSENTSAGEYSVSGENDTILTNKDGTSESVKISKVASVKGGLMLELSDGRTVSAKDISYATSGEAALYAAIADMNITAEAANSLIAGAATSGLSMESYALGVKEAYRFGKLGIPYDQISGKGFAVDLNDAQRKTAYYLGSNAGASEASEKSSAAASTAKRNKEGKIVYENVNLNGRKLNDQQRAGIQLAKFLARSGISVHVYESVKGKDGKYRNRFGGANGVYSNGTIYIDLAAGNSGQGTMAYTISHELTHLIEKTSPVEFRTFANALFDELGKSKVDVDQMIATKLEQVKNQAQNRNKSESELYDIAYSEVVAECCETMLTDTDAATRVASKICQQNKSLGQKILNFLKDLVKKLQQAYKDMNLAPDSQIANQARQTIQNVESLRDLWSDALAATIQRVNGKNVQTTQSVAGGDVDIDGQENVHMLSDRTMAEGAGFVFHELTGDGKPYEILDKNGNVVTHATVDQVKSSPLGSLVGTAVTNGFITDKEAEKQYEYLTKLVNMAIKYEGLAPVWEISGSMVFSSIKDNSDPQYGLTIDFSTICKKTQAIVDAMSKTMMELGRGLTRSEVEKVYLETGKAGESTPCPVCYVFSRWFGIGGLLDQIKRYQETYYEMSDADIQKFIADCDAEIFDYAAEKNKPNYYDKSGWLNTGKVISDVKGKYDALAAKALKSLANNANLQIQIQEMEELLKMQSGKEAQKTQRRIQKLRSKIVDAAAAEAAYNEANANKERFEAYQWMTSTMLMDQDGKYVRNPDFKPVPNSVLFDLNKGGEFAENYPLSWAFRTGKGSAMGKAITPYADARVGEAIQGVAKGKVKDIQIGMDLNPFLNGDNKTRDKIINSAIAKIRRQNLIGGMRYQSTSDFRYEFGSDYLITFMEMQAIGAKVQLYTKVIEAVDFLASMGADCNLSVMPLGDGYVTQADGTKKLVFSSVTGINADAAIQKAHQYNNVQLILVGINDENIRLALAGEDVTFVIPFHGSGQNVHQIQTLMNLLGENLDVVKAQDYEKVQTDHVDPNRTEAQQAAWDLRTRIIKGQATEITADDLAILESNKYLKDLYRRFYLDEDAEEYGLSLKGDAAKQIFPYEYWDRSLTYAQADQNGERFKEYCASMGIIPRFSGKDSAGRDMGFGDFSNDKGYWKLLIDRKMYENTYDENGNWTGYGKFHEQAKINCSKFEVSQLDREYGSKTYGDVMSKENDPSKTDAIVRNAIASFQNKSSVMISDKLAAAKGDLHSDREYSERDEGYAPKFYSFMGKVVDAVKQEKLGAASVVSMLRGKGVKAEEIKWSGIEQWLDGKKSVTKSDLQEFIRNSMLQVEDVTLDGRDIPLTKSQLAEIDKYEEAKKPYIEKLNDLWLKATGKDLPFDQFGPGISSRVMEQIHTVNAQIRGNTPQGIENRKAARNLLNVIADSEDYLGFDSPRQAFDAIKRDPELFLSGAYDISQDLESAIEMYTFAKNEFKNVTGIDSKLARGIADLADEIDKQNKFISRIKADNTHERAKYRPAWSDYKTRGGTNYRELLYRLPNADYTNAAMSMHWGESIADGKNVVAHARIQDFTDTSGRKILFIDEIQSDWHNEGHKKGYETEKPNFEVRLEEKYGAKRFTLYRNGEPTDHWNYAEQYQKEDQDWNPTGEYDTTEALNDLLKYYNDDDSVPDAPFRDTYTDFVLKNLIRMAAEGGYDGIGWTTGKMQEGRWSDDYAEGYRIEYDQQIPSFLRKYGKKWGSSVGTTSIVTNPLYSGDTSKDIESIDADIKSYEEEIASGEYDEDYIQFAREGIEELNARRAEIAKTMQGDSIPFFNISQSMKDSVLYEGQPLYSDRDSLTTDKQRDNYDYNLNNNTPGSPLRTMAYTKKTGGNIERMGGVVGKNLGSSKTPWVYFHRQYLQDAMKTANISAADYSKAFDILKEKAPELAKKFNHLAYNATNESIMFGYSPDFDTAREPIAGEQLQVFYNTGKTVYKKNNQQIFHHKWLWVEDGYTGFDTTEAWEWSKQWLNALRPTTEVGGGFAPKGIADGTNIAAWNRQLEHFGLPLDTGGKSLYSLRTVDPVQPTSGWSRGSTYADIRSEYPGFRNSDAKNEYVEDMNPDYESRKAERIKLAQRTAAGKRGNGTQRPNTVVTYDRLYDKLEREGFKGTILDASSGLGLGTDHGIKRGFDVEDIEPYFGDGYYPIYSDYSRLNKQYDVVISSAVINVLTQDDSDAMVKAIGNALKPGGRAFITVRGASSVDSSLKDGDSVRLSDTAHEWYVPGSDNYQRGWGADEFLAYVRDALGDGYKVEKNPKYWDVKKGKEEKWGDTSVLVTKSADYELHSDRIVEQKHTSAGTSMNVDKIPVLYTKAGKKGFFKSGTVNIDIGAGKYDTATEYLDGLGVTNMPFDPFNRTRSVNKEVVDFLVAGGKADTATCSNCLNVIDNADARANVVLEMAKAIKPDGVALFTVYSDEKSLQAGKAGQNARKPDQWQEFRALSTYSEEVKRYFDDVTIRDGTIIARSPKANLPKAAWQIASQYSAVENGASDEAVMYSSRTDSEGNRLTEAQERFFADSKIRDENGKLRVVYHGTDSDFTVFDPAKSRTNADIQGMFFSPWDIDAGGYGGNLGSYYLNIKNPAPEGIGYRALNMFKGQNQAGKKAREYLIKKGYDGVNNSDEEYIAFYPEQIKRIDNQNPTESEDIRFAERTRNVDLAWRDDVAVTIKNTKMANYIHLIFDKDSRGNYFKTEETRSQKTLEEYVGKQVMISDGKRVYGVVEFGKPRFIEAKDFHSKENQLKHRVPRGDDYDVKGKGKWAYPITVIEKYKTPKKLSDSNEYQYSFQARTVMYSSREETTRIKEQISAITDKLNEMDVVVSVTTSGFKGYRNSDVAKYVSDEFSKFGSRVERKDFGVVLLEYAQINKALNYLNTEAEKVALLTVPRVIKRGILAESHVDHKDRREVDSYTFAAPVEINGVRGNVGVVVQRVTGTNRFKTLRILLPNGKAFEFAQKNEADSTTGSKLAQSARGTPIESASDLKLSQNGIDVNKSDFRKSDRDDGGMSNRRLLVNALDTAVQSDLEERKLDQYREKIEQVSEEQIKLGELNKQIHELSFGKGKRDTAKLQALRDEATKTANRINLIDKQLLTLESTKVLKNVLEREREKARKAAEQKGREAVAAARKAAAQRQQEIVDKYREKRQEAIDKRISTQYRNKIKKYMEDFRKRLMSPTDRKYIPAALVEGIVDLYDAIDPTGKDPNSKAAQKYQSVKEALADIKMQYDGLKDSDSYDFKSEFSEEFSSVIAELANSIGNTPLRKMSRAQLEDVYSIIHDIAAMVTYATKQIGTKEAITNYEAGTQIIEAMDKARSAGISRDAINSFFREWTLNPMRAVREMSMFDQDARLVKLFTDLNEGRKKADKFSMDSHKKFDALRSDKAGEKAFNDAVETAGIKVTDADGNEQHISKMQAMQAILTFEREMANDKRNHLRSPVRFTNVALDVKGRYSDAFDRGYDVYVNVDFVDQVMKQLSDWDKNYMAMARRFFNVDSKNAVNETTMITKHRPVAMENAYIPYYVNQDYIAKESENVKFDASIEGMGMLKSVKNNAPQQIVIRGLNQVISDHIGKVSKVYGLAVPVRNWNKAFNVRQTDEDGGRSVKSAIRDAWHDGGLKLLDQAVADVQSNRRAESVAALSTVKSAFVTSTLASNLSVWMKQAASYPTAGAYLSTVSLAKALPKFGMNLKKTWNEIDEHTSQHYIRRLGMSTQELGEVNQTHGWQNRLNKKLGALSPMNWIQAMDVKTTAVLWEACKYEVQSKGTKAGSENYWDEVTKLYDKVIEETQPMYDSLHRAEITKNAALRNIIMFQTQPIQNSGILREGAMEYKMAKKQYGAKSQQANAAAKKYAMAVGSQLASHFVFTAMTLLSAALMHKMNPWRDDDTNEVTSKSVSIEFLRQFGTNVFGAIFPVFGSYAISIAEKISGASKYDVLSDPTVDKINTTIDNFTKLFVEDKDGNTVPSLDGFLTMACDIASYFSIPAGNIRNIVNGARMHIEDAANGEFLSFDSGAKPSNSQKRDSLYEAIMSGDKAAIANAKARYETQKEIDAAMRSALRENDPRIQEAAKAQIAGNNDKRVSIARQIIAEGHFSQNIVVAAINNEISALSKKEDEEYNARDVSLYTTDDYVKAILNGKDTTQIVKEIVRSKLVNGSKDEEAAYKALLSSAKSQLKETFLEGKLTSSDVVDALMAMDMTESAARKRVQYWDFADKHEDVDWSENNVDNYITTVEPAGISVDVFDSYLTKASKCKGTDANNDGKTDSGSVKTEVLAVINALPISSYQKDVLYRLNGWSERELRKAPWH